MKFGRERRLAELTLENSELKILPAAPQSPTLTMPNLHIELHTKGDMVTIKESAEIKWETRHVQIMITPPCHHSSVTLSVYTTNRFTSGDYDLFVGCFPACGDSIFKSITSIVMFLVIRLIAACLVLCISSQ